MAPRATARISRWLGPAGPWDRNANSDELERWSADSAPAEGMLVGRGRLKEAASSIAEAGKDLGGGGVEKNRHGAGR